jgi:hypothetical protein
VNLTCRFAIVFALTVCACQAQFFPTSSLDRKGDDLKARWYSAQLQALNEPSLFRLATDRTSHSYRFLWLRTFNHPVAIRVDIKPDRTGVLTAKVASGAGGYAPGTLLENTTRDLDEATVRSFLNLLDKTKFWKAPNPVNDQRGTDGSQWIVEGVKNGKYHVVDRWMPQNGPAHDIGVFLAFQLAKMRLPEREIY